MSPHFEQPKRLSVRNVGTRPIRRQGKLIEPARASKDRDGKAITIPPPVVELTVQNVRQELQLTACQSLEVTFLEGEPHRAETGGNSLSAELRERAGKLIEQADQLEQR